MSVATLSPMNCPDNFENLTYETYRSDLGPVILHKDFTKMITIFREKIREANQFAYMTMGTLNDYTTQFTNATDSTNAEYRKKFSDLKNEQKFLNIAVVILTIVACALGIALIIVAL